MPVGTDNVLSKYYSYVLILNDIFAAFGSMLCLTIFYHLLASTVSEDVLCTPMPYLHARLCNFSAGYCIVYPNICNALVRILSSDVDHAPRAVYVMGSAGKACPVNPASVICNDIYAVPSIPDSPDIGAAKYDLGDVPVVIRRRGVTVVGVMGVPLLVSSGCVAFEQRASDFYLHSVTVQVKPSCSSSSSSSAPAHPSVLVRMLAPSRRLTVYGVYHTARTAIVVGTGVHDTGVIKYHDTHRDPEDTSPLFILVASSRSGGILDVVGAVADMYMICGDGLFRITGESADRVQVIDPGSIVPPAGRMSIHVPAESLKSSCESETCSWIWPVAVLVEALILSVVLCHRGRRGVDKRAL